MRGDVANVMDSSAVKTKYAHLNGWKVAFKLSYSPYD